MLLLGYFDGMSFLPVNFTLHREIGKRPSKSNGFVKSFFDLQFGQNRDSQTTIGKRKTVIDTDKISTAITMIRTAAKFLDVDYLLMDSWFTCLKMLDLAGSLNVKLIGMMKMGTAKYKLDKGEFTAKEILAKQTDKPKGCRKLNAHYYQFDVSSNLTIQALIPHRRHILKEFNLTFICIIIWFFVPEYGL